jgi:hypothetical protein
LLAELANGSALFRRVKLDGSIDGESDLQWDGKQLAIGSYIHPGRNDQTPILNRFSISDYRATPVGRTVLGKPAHLILQFDIFDKMILVPNWHESPDGFRFNVLRYDYPAGGLPTLTITRHVGLPRGVVISFAASH